MEMVNMKMKEDAVEELNKFGIRVVFGLAALIGIWGVACMIGGLAVAGGPIALAKYLLVAMAI